MITSLDDLEERLSRPSDGVVDDLAGLDGDVVVLGAGGKLGPSLVRLATRSIEAAGTKQRVYAVSRFTRDGEAEALRAAGAEVVVADISEPGALAGLPDVPNVVFLVGAKFGTSTQPDAMWATNTYLPGRVAARFTGGRIVVLSTGNVYPLVPISSGGCTESDPVGPVGEYAMSCLGRERIFTHLAAAVGTSVALMRLNYATELRYGVLVDIARAVHEGRPVDVTTGHVNVVWQGYANAVALRLLAKATNPPFVLNVTGPELISVAQLARRFGDRFGRQPELTGEPAPTALLSNAGACHRLFGYPDVTVAELVEWTSAWVAAGGATLGKPTRFQTRDGRF